MFPTEGSRMAPAKRNYKNDFPRLIDRLENMIVIGRLQPRERLVEADLASLFNVSRAWIRDALKILETKGLVKMIPFRGATVAQLSEAEVEEIFQIRVVLERLCNQLALQNFRFEHAEPLRRLANRIKIAYEENRFAEMLAANAEFHNLIAEIAGNKMLIGMLQQLRSRFHLFNTFAWSSPELVGQIIREHEQYIEALEKGESSTLGRLAESHISYSKDLYLKQLKGHLK
jgi:DNA-binding GntR family transcriptional regulator